MSPRRLCGVFALVSICLSGYASIAAMLVSNADVQARFSQIFRPQIDFSLAASVLNSLSLVGLFAAICALAVAQLISQEVTPPSTVHRRPPEQPL